MVDKLLGLLECLRTNLFPKQLERCFPHYDAFTYAEDVFRKCGLITIAQNFRRFEHSILGTDPSHPITDQPFLISAAEILIDSLSHSYPEANVKQNKNLHGNYLLRTSVGYSGLSNFLYQRQDPASSPTNMDVVAPSNTPRLSDVMDLAVPPPVARSPVSIDAAPAPMEEEDEEEEEEEEEEADAATAGVVEFDLTRDSDGVYIVQSATVPVAASLGRYPYSAFLNNADEDEEFYDLPHQPIPVKPVPVPSAYRSLPPTAAFPGEDEEIYDPQPYYGPEYEKNSPPV